MKTIIYSKTKKNVTQNNILTTSDMVLSEMMQDIMDKEEMPGHSIKKIINGKPEWCVEPYIEINSENFDEQDFQSTLKEYVAYAFTNSLIEEIKKERKKKLKIKLDIKQWKYFKIGNIFNIYTGGDKPKEDDGVSEFINSIENQTINNGVSGQIQFTGSKIFNNFISIVSIGEGGHSFYHQEKGAVFTRVKALIPKFKMSSYIGLFFVPILNLEKARYSYGRVVDAGRLKKTKIKLPVNKNNNPDFKFMEDYIKGLPYSSNLK